MSNKGKNVKCHYTGTLDDGSKFDSSYDRNEPLAFTCGAGQMIPGFDKAVEDMEVGETKTVRLEPSEAYGEKDPNALIEFPYSQMPNAKELAVGEKVFLRTRMGQPVPVVVAEQKEDAVVFDANHELAGQHLTFEITLVEVQ